MTIASQWTVVLLLLCLTIQISLGQGTGSTSTTASSGTVVPSPSPTNIPVQLVGGAPKPRYGASAQLIRDQSVIVFFGGYVATPHQGFYPDLNTPFELQPSETVVTLAVNQGFEFNTGNWQSAVNTNLSVPARNLDHDPRVTAYGSSAAVRGVDIGTNQNVDVFYYVFGQNYNTLLDPTVYQYNHGNGIIGVLNNQVTAPPSRNRAVSCLIDSTTTIFHGGLSGVDNSATTQTLSSTWFLSLKNITSQRGAWESKKTDSFNDPTLHSHMGACLSGNAYMVGGVTDKFDAIGNLVLAPMDHMWVFAYTNSLFDGVWTKVMLSGPKGFPSPRRSGTLTAANPGSNTLYLHGGTTSDFSETFSDLWQLDINNRQWIPLAPSKFPRHSHNTLFVNGMLINVFGAMSDANSTNPPPAVTPPLWVYNTIQNTWGGFPGSASLSPSPPSAFPPHISAISSPTAGNGSGDNAGTNTTFTNSNTIYGLIGAGAAGIFGIFLFIFLHKFQKRRREKQQQRDQEMEEEMREQQMGSSSFAAVIGMSTNQISDMSVLKDRKVGGKLARVIELNQSGTTLEIQQQQQQEEEETYIQKAEDEDVKSIVSGSRCSFTALDLPSYLIDGGLAVTATAKSSSDGGFTSDASSSSAHHSEGKAEERSNSQLSTTRPTSSFFQASSTSLKGVFGGQNRRNSKLFGNKELLEPLQPLRPWELPGMGVQRSTSSLGRHSPVSAAAAGATTTTMPVVSRSASRNSQRESRINLAGLIGDLPDVEYDDRDDGLVGEVAAHAVYGVAATHGNMIGYFISRQDSIGSNRFSIASTIESGSGIEPFQPQQQQQQPQQQQYGYFDPTQSMKMLFGKFNNEQILESWNAYSQTTGMIYTIEQVEAMRTLHAPDTTTTVSTSTTLNLTTRSISASPTPSSSEMEMESQIKQLKRSSTTIPSSPLATTTPLVRREQTTHF
ncbi:hypothetical protein BDR26DRAFT_1008815 [Obelidium mucronatum]|nr:hypothetical protein BDR26DRAFT_1008815 [Obelidium mucronatum]